jgi:putative membrane protein
VSQPTTALSLVEPQRQSLLAILFLALRLIRNIGILQIVIGIGFVLSRSPSLLLLTAGLFIFAVISLTLASLSWWRYTFAVANGELVVRRGVISQDTLTVPLDRVQSVSIEQKLLHRAVGLVQVSLDTAGTSTAEFTIDAIDRSVADALQRAAADYRRDANGTAHAPNPAAGDEAPNDSFVPRPPEPAERVVLRHDARRILTIALTQMPFSGLAVLAPLFAFGDNLIDRIPVDTPEVDVDGGAWLLWFVPAVILVIVLASVLLNIIRVVLADWNLTITSTAAGLRRDAGLFSTSSVASSLPRVQRVEVRQDLLERFAGIRTTTLHNIGEGNFRVPGCDTDQAAELRSLGLDGGEGVSVLDRRVSSLEVFKEVRNASIMMGLIAIGLWFLISWWSVLALLIVPLVWLSTGRQVRLRRWGIDADAVADRREFLGWKSEEALLRKVNGVTVRQSLFERKRGLATVQVQMAGSSIAIGMIPLADARAVRDLALYVAETDRRAFM